MASLIFSSATDTSITVLVTGMDGSFSRTRYFHWFLDGVWVDNTTTPPYATTTSHTYPGLSPGTSHNLAVSIYDSNDATLLASLGPISGSTTGSSGGTVQIVSGGVWKTATVYVVDGGVWKQATPYIVSGLAWKATS